MTVERSANGLRLSTADGDQNHIYSVFLRLRARSVGTRFSTVFSGAEFSGAFGGDGRQSLVPAALERVGDTTHGVLAAGRLAKAYGTEQLPPHIAVILDEVGAPHFAVK